MSNTKSTKKNTTTIEWPSAHFTIEDVQSKYPSVVNITLRFRVKKAVENKEIVTIGKIKPAIGRPKLVFAKANPSKELIESAKAVGVLTFDEKSMVAVAELKSQSNMSKMVASPVSAMQTSMSADASI